MGYGVAIDDENVIADLSIMTTPDHAHDGAQGHQLMMVINYLLIYFAIS